MQMFFAGAGYERWLLVLIENIPLTQQKSTIYSGLAHMLIAASGYRAMRRISLTDQMIE